MTYKKLALAVAIAAIPAVGFSVETLEDTDLSGVTGQDGIEVAINIGAAGITTDLYIHDKTGLDNSLGVTSFTSYSYDGAIVIDNMAVGVGGAAINISIDAGDRATSASAPVLNINVALPNALTISTGDIYVANSRIDDGGRGIDGPVGPLLNNMTVILGSTAVNIQLGNEVQTGSLAGTDMIAISAVVNGGVVISNFALNDINSGGTIGASSISLRDANGSGNLTLAVDGNVTSSGLVLGLGTVGATGLSIEVVDQYLGSVSAGIIGDMSVVGLNVSGTTVTISGK